MKTVTIILIILLTISCSNNKKKELNKNNKEPINSSLVTSEQFIIKPEGLYEYISDSGTENFCIEFFENQFFYGTTDLFDEAREGYQPGFFTTKISDLSQEGNTITFSLNPEKIKFYQTQITPLSGVEIKNTPWEVISNLKGIVKFKGTINHDFITFDIKGFSEPLKFIRITKP